MTVLETHINRNLQVASYNQVFVVNCLYLLWNAHSLQKPTALLSIEIAFVTGAIDGNWNFYYVIHFLKQY